ncbi:hypothetical protein HETIRDRAFT_450115 [Heterobasidion irregulare TC 32-1]|uniref:Uncharacterized protein n=1 Tax=Heterobasidion irregulare (strain TC 32-1) TaxID=747525 RepID=W4KI01_HETIT|nr:uncharacterized protein HETIRDRAFT_450115 [Heterobasidion irregulare TC 32-1]ETW84706.1 hypothetical protein HETIRDRAFT_450115 [Heterobasidion irregulare TC 32-1]
MSVRGDDDDDDDNSDDDDDDNVRATGDGRWFRQTVSSALGIRDGRQWVVLEASVPPAGSGLLPRRRRRSADVVRSRRRSGEAPSRRVTALKSPVDICLWWTLLSSRVRCLSFVPTREAGVAKALDPIHLPILAVGHRHCQRSSAQSARAAVCQSATAVPYRMGNPAYSLAARQPPTARRGAISGESARSQWRCRFNRSRFFVHGSRLYETPHSRYSTPHLRGPASSLDSGSDAMDDSIVRAPAIRNSPRHCVAVRVSPMLSTTRRRMRPPGDLPLPAPPQDARRTNPRHATPRHATPLRPVSGLARLTAARAHLRDVRRADLAAGSAPTTAAGDVPALDSPSPSPSPIHSSTRASVRSPGAAREASLQAPEIPMRASPARVCQDEASTADGQSQRRSQSEVCYRDYN